MLVTFKGKCKNCGAPIEISDNPGGKLSLSKNKLMCPICGIEISASNIERLASIAVKIHSCALFVDPFQLDSIILSSTPKDPERLRAQQSENDFRLERLKEIEAEFGDRE